MEPNTRNAAPTTVAIETFTERVLIECVHYRRRFADPDNLAIKASLDSIVAMGILRNDEAKDVKRISHEQVKVDSIEEERTVFIITSAED